MKKYLTMIGVGLLLCSCSSDSPEPVNNPENPSPETQEQPVEYSVLKLTPAEKKICDAQNGFGFRLFEKAVQMGCLSGNGCISPLSLHEVLSMAANADSGTIRDEIMKCLLGDDNTFSIGQLNEFNKKMAQGLPATEESVTIRLSNSLWGLDADGYNENFYNTLKEYYNPYFSAVSPSTAEGMQEINSWVKNNTNGLIAPLLDAPLSSLLMMINTLYFKGSWTQPFDVDDTRPAIFTDIDGKTALHEMMTMTADVQFAENEGNKLMIKEFGTGNFEMMFMLPDKDADFRAFAANLRQNLNTLEKEMARAEVTMTIPRFESAFNKSITDVFNELCGRNLLNEGFDSYTKEGKHSINTILHNVKFRINEAGAEGAAASALGFDTALEPEETDEKTMRLDRPFLYLVRERNTGAILFIGQVTSLD